MKTAAIFALLACAANAFVLPTPKVSQVRIEREQKKDQRSVL